MKRLILFLIRRRLGLKLNEQFRFANQNSPYDFYFFTPYALMKYEYRRNVPGISFMGNLVKAHVSLNWLLDDECEIIKTNTED